MQPMQGVFGLLLLFFFLFESNVCLCCQTKPKCHCITCLVIRCIQWRRRKKKKRNSLFFSVQQQELLLTCKDIYLICVLETCELQWVACYTILAFASSTSRSLQLPEGGTLPLLVVPRVKKKKKKTIRRVVCFAKLLSVFIQYLKCGIDVTFCSGRLRLFF